MRMSITTRNTVLVITAAATASMLLCAPVFASPKGGTGGALAGIVKQYHSFCGALEDTYKRELAAAGAAGNSNPGAGQAHGLAANQAYTAASQNGCGWAS